MNFVAGVFLFSYLSNPFLFISTFQAFILLVSNFKEYETYCFFVRFMDAYELKGFFHEQFPLLKVYVEGN
jgi:hypothetical protein